MLLKFSYIIDWKYLTAKKQGSVGIINSRKNTRQVIYEYIIGNILYVDNNGIYLTIDYNKYDPYRITEVFTSGTVWVQRGAINEWIKIGWL